MGALFELHIEQGPILEAEGQRIGIVTGAQGARWYDCKVTGAETHAGAAPMEGRRDALRGAAALLEGIFQIAHRYAPSGRATIGEFQAYPGSRNTVPGRVRFTVDLRHPDGGTMDAMDHGLREAFEQARGRSAGQLEYHLEEIWYAPPVAFDPDCIEAVRQATTRLGLPSREIVSGAGHDAVYMARVVPTAMIFVPCKDGISHAEIEYASPDACADGANVLLHAVLTRANS
jgi:N-carbamoyl-L-amino-acid hydrolase